MKDKIVHASDVKPDFKQVKRLGRNNFNYYDYNGDLKDKYTEIKLSSLFFK